jgi:hypothetical protein
MVTARGRALPFVAVVAGQIQEGIYGTDAIRCAHFRESGSAHGLLMLQQAAIQFHSRIVGE